MTCLISVLTKRTYNLILHCFKSYHFTPLTWQSLLRDRDKLCQLLEQHPKLMQMLQVVFLGSIYFTGLVVVY